MPFCSRCTFATVSWLTMRLTLLRNRSEGPYGSGSCSLRQWLSRSFFAYFFLNVHLHQSSKVKSKKEATKQYKSRFYFLFFLMMEGSGSEQIMMDPDGPKTYGLQGLLDII
jgi:hypothetical protein